MPKIRHLAATTPYTWGGRARELLPGDQIDWHRHERDQFVYPASGVVSALTDSRTWVLPSPGRGLYLPAGVRHAHRAHRHTVLHTLLLPPGLLPVGAGAPRVLPVSSLLAELLAALTDRKLPQGRRDRLLAVVADQLDGADEPTLTLPRPDDPRLADAARALQSDPANASVASLAAAAAVSPRTLTRLVADRLGLTVPHWRAQYRLAASLLWLTDGVSVTVTAHRCGWRNASSYIAAFQAAFGTTPRAYQRSLSR